MHHAHADQVDPRVIPLDRPLAIPTDPATFTSVFEPTANAAAKLATTPDPDAELLENCRRVEICADAIRTLYRREDGPSKEYDDRRPPWPEAVFARKADTFNLCLNYNGVGLAKWDRDGKLYYSDDQVEELRANPRVAPYYPTDDEEAAKAVVPSSVPDIETQKRADEIVVAADAFKAACAALREETGLAAIERLIEEQNAIENGLREKIISTSARTLAGVIAKARVCALTHGDFDPAEEAMEAADERLAWSVIRDLAAPTAPQVILGSPLSIEGDPLEAWIAKFNALSREHRTLDHRTSGKKHTARLDATMIAIHERIDALEVEASWHMAESGKASLAQLLVLRNWVRQIEFDEEDIGARTLIKGIERLAYSIIKFMETAFGVSAEEDFGGRWYFSNGEANPMDVLAVWPADRGLTRDAEAA